MNVKVETYEFNDGRFVLRVGCPFAGRVSPRCWHLVTGRTSTAVTEAIVEHVKHKHGDLIDVSEPTQ